MPRNDDLPVFTPSWNVFDSGGDYTPTNIYVDLTHEDVPPGGSIVDQHGNVLYQGGPEESGPPVDIDTPRVQQPLPSEPNNQPPAIYEPPISGEHIPADEPPPAAQRPGVIIEGEAERFDMPGEYSRTGRIPGTRGRTKEERRREAAAIRRRREIERKMRDFDRTRRDVPQEPPKTPLPPLPTERDIERVLSRGIGRVVLGPIGGVLGPILVPQDFGSGELPFPPIPRVDIPPPRVELPEPTVPPGRAPPDPIFDTPPAPDVVIATPPAPQRAPRVPRQRQRAPKLPGFSLPKGLVGAVVAPILRRLLQPRPAPLPQNFPAPAPVPQPAPEPTRPTTATPEPTPLTPQEPTPLPLPAPSDFGAPQQPQLEQTDECNCQKCKKCRRNKKRKQKLSDTIAHMQPFQRRMSAYSLKNLKRGGIQRHLKRKP